MMEELKVLMALGATLAFITAVIVAATLFALVVTIINMFPFILMIVVLTTTIGGLWAIFYRIF